VPDDCGPRRTCNAAPLCEAVMRMPGGFRLRWRGYSPGQGRSDVLPAISRPSRRRPRWGDVRPWGRRRPRLALHGQPAKRLAPPVHGRLSWGVL